MGILIVTKEPVFKQKHKVSNEPIYPICLKELSVINSIKMDATQK